MKCKNLSRLLIDLYVLVSLLIPITATNFPLLYYLGSGSWLFTMLLFNGGWLTGIIGIMASVWVLSFPILLIVFYFMARKEKYIPFCVIVSMDAVVSVLILIHSLTQNTHALEITRPDAIVSVLYAAALIISVYCRTGDGSLSYKECGV